MKKLLTFILLMFSVLCFYSCSSNELEYTEEQDLTNEKLEAVANFNKAFQKEFPYLVLTRASSVNVEGEAYDSVCASTGRKICKDLEKSTDLLLTSFSITEEDIIDAFNDNHDLQEYSSIEELKCFTALAIYESTKTRTPYTRATTWDYVSCIGLGQTTKTLFDMPAKKIAKFAAKKLVGRLVPYVGWGWGVASAVYCISRL